MERLISVVRVAMETSECSGKVKNCVLDLGMQSEMKALKWSRGKS